MRPSEGLSIAVHICRLIVFHCMYVRLSFYMCASVWLGHSASPHIFLIYKQFPRKTRFSLSLSLSLSVFLSISLFLCMFIYPSVSVHLSVCLGSSVYPSVCPIVSLSVCAFSKCVSRSIYTHVCLYVCLSLRLPIFQ